MLSSEHMLLRIPRIVKGRSREKEAMEHQHMLHHILCRTASYIRLDLRRAFLECSSARTRIRCRSDASFFSSGSCDGKRGKLWNKIRLLIWTTIDVQPRLAPWKKRFTDLLSAMIFPFDIWKSPIKCHQWPFISCPTPTILSENRVINFAWANKNFLILSKRRKKKESFSKRMRAWVLCPPEYMWRYHATSKR